MDMTIVMFILVGTTLPQIMSIDLENALSKCVNLTSLDIGTNGLLTSLSFLMSMPRLERLVLDFCVEIDLSDLKFYIKFCPLVQELSMYRCTQLTHAAVIVIMAALPKLKRLNCECALEFSAEEIQAVLDAGHLTSFLGTPDDSFGDKWLSLPTKYPNVEFNDAVADRCKSDY